MPEYVSAYNKTQMETAFGGIVDIQNAAAAISAEFPDWTSLDTATNIKVGRAYGLTAGALGSPETVKIVAAGTYPTPDGVLVRNLTASGLQAVSTRQEYASFAEFDADPRGLTSGQWSVPSEGVFGTYVSTGEDYTTTAGTKVVASAPNGAYPASAFPVPPAKDTTYLYGPDFVSDPTTHILYNFPADDNQRVIGQEYLATLHAQVITSNTQFRLAVWGDSRPANQGTTGTYKWEEALQWGARLRGYYKGTFVNQAIGGSTLQQWYTSYCDTYLTGTNDPHCIVICAGINDLDNGTSTPEQVVGYLDDFLNKVRVTKGYSFSALSIVVVIPVAAYNPSRLRDPRYIEPLRNGFKRVCRKYQAVCVDGYAVAADAYNGRGISYLTDLTAPEDIHQNNVGAVPILNEIVNTVFPPMEIFARNGIFQESGTAYQPAVTDLPTAYPLGISIYRATPGGGGTNWPLDGTVVTHNFVDDIQIQYNFATVDTGNALYMRQGHGGSWGSWHDMFGSTNTNVAPATGFTLPGTTENMAVTSNGAIVVGDGYLNVTTPGTIASGTQIATIPIGFVPSRKAYGIQLAAFAAGAWQYIHGEIDNATGNLTLQEAVTVTASRIYFGPSVWKTI